MVVKEVAKWAAPIISGPDLDSQLDKAMSRKDISKAFTEYRGDPKNFRDSLREYIRQENEKNYGLIKFSRFIDSFNKATVPVDAALDYFNIMGGVGSAARGLKTLATLPGYLAYDMYYLGKTGDFVGTLKNIGYEGISWLMLGSIPHLLNNYTNQTDNYSIESASQRFMKGLEARTISVPTDEKVEAVRKTRKGDLESALSTAA